MRDQYAGDVSDVLKFAFLRALAGSDRKLGVAWYYNPGHDGRSDGLHLEWREEIAWNRLDSELFHGLRNLPERSVSALEAAPIWPSGTLFYRPSIPQTNKRSEWSEAMRVCLESSELVFLDPDNGLGMNSKKHATFEEIRSLKRLGRVVIFITFPGRVKHEFQVARLHQRLKEEAEAEALFTLRTHVSVRSEKNPNLYLPRFRWFTVIGADNIIKDRAAKFTKDLSFIPRASGILVV
jgi:hypothetical protein